MEGLKTMEIKIDNFPQEFAIRSRGAHVVARPESWPAFIHANIYAYGLHQVVADAASQAMDICGFKGLTFKSLDEPDQAKVMDKTRELMQTKLDQFANGEWRVRTPSESVDPIVDATRWVVRNVLFKAPAYADDAARYKAEGKGKTQAERDEWLDDYVATFDDELATYVNQAAEKRLAQLEAEARAKAEQIAAIPMKAPAETKKKKAS